VSNKYFWRWAGLILIGLLAAPAWSATTITGRVVSVADGDTITVLVAGNRQVKVRLAAIDTPEKKQAWGRKAKKSMSNLVFGHQVTVQVLKKDRYKRSVGRVYVGGRNVGRELVANGDAWVYRKYSRDPELLALEQQAREQRRGLWALPAAQRVPPWEWRYRKKPRSTQTRQPKPRTSLSTCGTKKYCGQMSSCAEARYYLNQCGVASLDGNHDGIPSNKLCRRGSR
jgi:endonuclease YncB( thermonuclease family)